MSAGPWYLGLDLGSAWSKAVLLGLTGREFLRLSRIASAPGETVTKADALFALYLLVAARVKASAV